MFNQRITSKQISIIIPVKDNQLGIEKFLASFFATQTPPYFPKEIIIVDNNSSTPILIPSKFLDLRLDIRLLSCHKPGPAAARNKGASIATGQWLLFIDSDCIATEPMLKGYIQSEKEVVGYQGYIDALGKDVLSNYYISQHIHLPSSDGDQSPKYLVTANALVYKDAFDQVGGFNESFILAGGEDIDLALRLKEIGKLVYAPQSVVLHDFDDGMSGFILRFVRYGKGIAQVKKYYPKYRFPPPFTANRKSVIANHFLVIIQWLSMCYGFLYQTHSLKKTSPNVYS